MLVMARAAVSSRLSEAQVWCESGFVAATPAPTTNAPTPCVDIQPPAISANPTCESQVANTHDCALRRAGTKTDGLCAASCGVCQGPTTAPSNVPTWSPTSAPTAPWITEGNLRMSHQLSGASANSSRFGSSVAMDGDYIIVGESGETAQPGSAHVFVYESGAWYVTAQHFHTSTCNVAFHYIIVFPNC